MPYLRAFLFALAVSLLTWIGLSNNLEALPNTVRKVLILTFGNIFCGYWLGYYVERPTPLDERYNDPIKKPRIVPSEPPPEVLYKITVYENKADCFLEEQRKVPKEALEATEARLEAKHRRTGKEVYTVANVSHRDGRAV